MSMLECQDPLDRIFGVSRVLGLSQFDSLRPDYSLPVGELYRRTVEAFLTAPANRSAGRSAIMLALAGTERREAADFPRPSWVPNLQYLSERSRSKHAFYEWLLHNRQHGTQLIDFHCRVSPSDPEELMIKGLCFGHVETILDASECPSKHVHRRTGLKCTVDEGIDLVRWYCRCRDFLQAQFCTAADDQSTSFATMLNELFTLDRSTGSTSRTTSNTSLSQETVRQWIAMLPDGDNMLDEDVSALTRDLRPYVTGLPHDRDRKLCTVDGIMGRRPAWIPAQAMSGDKICQFSGAPFPFIVRDNTDGSYYLVGDSYVQGVHEPELLGADEPETSTLIATVADSQTSEAAEPAQRADQRAKYLYRQCEEQLEWLRLR